MLQGGRTVFQYMTAVTMEKSLPFAKIVDDKHEELSYNSKVGALQTPSLMDLCGIVQRVFPKLSLQ